MFIFFIFLVFYSISQTLFLMMIVQKADSSAIVCVYRNHAGNEFQSREFDFRSKQVYVLLNLAHLFIQIIMYTGPITHYINPWVYPFFPHTTSSTVRQFIFFLLGIDHVITLFETNVYLLCMCFKVIFLPFFFLRCNHLEITTNLNHIDSKQIKFILHH